jgi:hypothetical protein
MPKDANFLTAVAVLSCLIRECIFDVTLLLLSNCRLLLHHYKAWHKYFQGQAVHPASASGSGAAPVGGSGQATGASAASQPVAMGSRAILTAQEAHEYATCRLAECGRGEYQLPGGLRANEWLAGILEVTSQYPVLGRSACVRLLELFGDVSP